MAASSGARLLFGNSARRWLGDFTKLLPKVLRPLLAQCDNASPALRLAWLGRAVEGRARAGRRREQATGGSRGAKRFSRGAVYLMLQNWLYRGNVAHKEKIYPGQHEAIIEPEFWQAVQDRLAGGRRERSVAVRGGGAGPVVGLCAR